MSNRAIERITAAFIEIGQVMIENIDITKWGGAPVSPAVPKEDGASNAINVPEIGSRIQGYNAPSGNLGTWDLIRTGITSITSTFLGYVDTIPNGKHNDAGVVLADGEGAPLQLSNTGRLLVDAEATLTKSTTGTITSVAASLVSVTLLAANPNRLGATIFIDGGAANNVFVKMGAGASTVSFTVMLSRGDYYEVPFNYTGIITAIWSPAAAGNARITEFT